MNECEVTCKTSNASIAVISRRTWKNSSVSVSGGPRTHHHCCEYDSIKNKILDSWFKSENWFWPPQKTLVNGRYKRKGLRVGVIKLMNHLRILNWRRKSLGLDLEETLRGRKWRQKIKKKIKLVVSSKNESKRNFDHETGRSVAKQTEGALTADEENWARVTAAGRAAHKVWN